ncbi:hypothetical protein VIBNISFn118_1370024 [Vibrio nigripulchritudo SFn118]|nr:hypothetical protein VIBNISFn118_1370024 [Vibrio nigripulchritudo SFn118]
MLMSSNSMSNIVHSKFSNKPVNKLPLTARKELYKMTFNS